MTTGIALMIVPLVATRGSASKLTVKVGYLRCVLALQIVNLRDMLTLQSFALGLVSSHRLFLTLHLLALGVLHPGLVLMLQTGNLVFVLVLGAKCSRAADRAARVPFLQGLHLARSLIL